MAIDVCTEISSPGFSPRISFSDDLRGKDIVPVEEHRHDRLEPSSDFDFCISSSFFLQDLCSADELFSNGKILPVEIKKKNLIITQKETHHPEPIAIEGTEKKKRLKELLSISVDPDHGEIQKPPSSKSFWQFKKSFSLNCESAKGKSLISSLQFLSRSNSTGSTPNPKQAMPQKKDTQKHQKQQKQQSFCSGRRSSEAACSGAYYYPYKSSQKPPLKKKCGSYGNSVRISPVLNLAPPNYISRATVVNLFGFGSLFCNGKVSKKKKK